LTDEAAGVRRAAARALRRCRPSAEAQRALLAALADDDIWAVTEAILTLGALFGDDELIRWRLRAALDAPHPLARLAAIEALSAQGREREEWRAIARLARNDSQMEVRRVAALAFTRCPYVPMAVAAARAALGDEHWSVRRAAVEALAAHGTQAALRLLRHAATDEREEPPVRGAALAALAARSAPDAVEIICRVLESAEAALLEEAYPALLILRRTREDELRAATQRAAPRAASLIRFALAAEQEG
jgi:HEAT repeat protein